MVGALEIYGSRISLSRRITAIVQLPEKTTTGAFRFAAAVLAGGSGSNLWVWLRDAQTTFPITANFSWCASQQRLLLARPAESWGGPDRAGPSDQVFAVRTLERIGLPS